MENEVEWTVGEQLEVAGTLFSHGFTSKSEGLGEAAAVAQQFVLPNSRWRSAAALSTKAAVIEVQTALKVKAVVASPITVHWGSEIPLNYRPDINAVGLNVPDAFSMYAASVEREMRQLIDEVEKRYRKRKL